LGATDAWFDLWEKLMTDNSESEVAESPKGVVATMALAGRLVLAFLSIVLAVLGIFLAISPYTVLIAMGLALVSMVLSLAAKAGNVGGGVKFLATAGLVCSAVVFVSALVWAVLISNAAL